MIKKQTIYVCDNCGREAREEDAGNWIDIKPVGRWDANYTTVPSPVDGRDLYCSEACLLEKTAAKMAEVRRFTVETDKPAIAVDKEGNLYWGGTVGLTW